MNEINIVTAQNVTLKIELANIGDRFLAALLDMLIKLGVVFLTAMLVAVLKEAGVGAVITVTLWTICVLFFMLYSLMFEYFSKGQTPGKTAMKVKVVRLDGEQVTFGNLLLRWLFRIIDFPFTWPAIGISMVVFTKKFQRIGDLVAGTILVTTKDRTTLQDTSYTRLDSNYQPVFPQANQLSGKDVEIIKKVIRLYELHDKYDLLEETVARLKTVLDVHPDMDALNFLRTILKDYNYADSQTDHSRFVPQFS